MQSYLTLISNNPAAIRLPKINGQNDLTSCMGYGAYSNIDDLPEDASLYTIFSFYDEHVKKTANRLNFASFSGEHCLTFNLIPFRFYSMDGDLARKEARTFTESLGYGPLAQPFALFDFIKDDQSCECLVLLHAETCGALLCPSKTLCSVLKSLAISLASTYTSLDQDFYRLDSMMKKPKLIDCNRGDWPIEPGSDQCEILKSLILDSRRLALGARS